MRFLLEMLAAAGSGLLLAFVFPPWNRPWLAWVGLAPLAAVVFSSRSGRRAFLLALVSGTVFFLLTLHPLTSAADWIGWAERVSEERAALLTRQAEFLRLVWMTMAVIGGVCWGLWALLARAPGRSHPWRTLAVSVCAWVLIPEWLRMQLGFESTWGALGYALAGHDALRQLAALGGVWLASALVVAVNVALAWVVTRPPARAWPMPSAVAAMAAAAWLGGCWALARPSAPGPAVTVAALQFDKPLYTEADYSPWGFDLSYLPLIRQALEADADVIVLPESVAVGTMLEDGSASQQKPPAYQFPLDSWDRSMRALLRGHDAVLAVGQDTVDAGGERNTLSFWSAEGLLGTYHKRRLVPFSEYTPASWRWGPLKGRKQYVRGRGSRLIDAHGTALGGLLCQEIEYRRPMRASVRDGAGILINAGNDAPFTDPAVRELHHVMLRLAAAEAGRPIVRAMKSGISAVYDARGRVLAEAPPDSPAVLLADVAPGAGMTGAVRFPDWVLWLSGVILLAGLPRRQNS
ncbi:MAG TPA: apolipoprotein N-acyltransferase [bacterium]